MIVGFKARFVPFVRDGSKQHTLRDVRQGDRQIMVGDRLDLYGDVRQKTQHSLGRYLCTRVQIARFEFHEDRGAVMYIDGVELDPWESDEFAWTDGFRHLNEDGSYKRMTGGCFWMMIKYWYDEGKTLLFEKRLIHWDYTKPITESMTGLVPKKRKRP